MLLPYGAREHEVEAALSAIGLYAPRGPETLKWGVFPGAVATIFDHAGDPLIHLYDYNPDAPARVVNSFVLHPSKGTEP